MMVKNVTTTKTFWLRYVFCGNDWSASASSSWRLLLEKGIECVRLRIPPRDEPLELCKGMT